MNHPVSSGPVDLEARIRARGAVLDMSFTQSLYKSLLEQQPREGVRVSRDIRYGSDERHSLDVYQPKSGWSAPGPLVIVMPGGGFVRGDKAERENFGQCFARAGIVTAVANYRLAPLHRWPAGAEDVITAYTWMRQHATRFGVDPGRIFLVGESAGAAHVAAATLVHRFHPPQGLHVAGVVLISGVYNAQLELLARAQFGVATPDPRNEAYFGPEFDRYPAMSTVELIDAPPAARLLITYAELDPVGMQIQAGELFARLVTQHGYSPELRVIRGHNHLTQVYAVNTGDVSLSDPLLAFVQNQ
ncbi:MAG TPA: alpha/beta hydrolase [Steroidobacteraceae bacterium]